MAAARQDEAMLVLYEHSQRRADGERKTGLCLSCMSTGRGGDKWRWR